MNMYISLWNTLSAQVKANILSHKSVTGTYGLVLLCTLLKTYWGSASQVIWYAKQKIYILGDTLQELLKLKTDRFSDFIFKPLKTLTGAGGDES